MKSNQFPWLRIARTSVLLMASGCLAACAGLDPRRPEVELKEALPAMKVTSYTQALSDLGMMTEIYGTPALKIQSNPLGDNTGVAASSGGEIPKDITEIMKSSLNAIGGKVVYIPYDPSFIQNQTVTGYSAFRNKVIPDVVLSGGITEYDRALEMRGENIDANGEADFKNVSDDLPSKALEVRAGKEAKSGLARLTLDFNLLDFGSMTGIPKMNVVNSMEVRKASLDQELGISLFGQSFGLKGSVKKVQGRHAAVRLLVELSMIQLVGKHLRLPYWRLLGEGAKSDPVVLDQISDYFQCLTVSEVNACVQEWLYLYGFNLEITGRLDEATRSALQLACKDFDPAKNVIDSNVFTWVYLHIPLTKEAKKRREKAAWN